MAEFLSPDGLTGLGRGLLDFCWQGIALAVTLLLILRWGPRAPRIRYLAACLTLLAMVFAFGVSLWSQYGVSTSVTWHRSVSESAIPVTETEFLLISDGPAGLLSWISTVWLAGVTLLWIRLVGGWLIVSRMRRQGVRPASASLQRLCRRLARQIGLDRSVTLLESVKAGAPTTMGWLKPVILLPPATIGCLTVDQLEMVLLHELAHIRRADYFVNCLQAVAETLLFYHPAVWWVSAQIRREREACCDDKVVELSGDRLGYAHALARLAALPATPGQLQLTATGHPLVSRINRLLKGDLMPLHRPALYTVVLGLGLTLALPVAGAMTPRQQEKQEKKPVVVSTVTPVVVRQVRPLVATEATSGVSVRVTPVKVASRANQVVTRVNRVVARVNRVALVRVTTANPEDETVLRDALRQLLEDDSLSVSRRRQLNETVVGLLSGWQGPLPADLTRQLGKLARRWGTAPAPPSPPSPPDVLEPAAEPAPAPPPAPPLPPQVPPDSDPEVRPVLKPLRLGQHLTTIRLQPVLSLAAVPLPKLAPAFGLSLALNQRLVAPAVGLQKTKPAKKKPVKEKVKGQRLKVKG